MESVSPVQTDQEVEWERVLALDQPEYRPIIILPVRILQEDGSHIVGASVRLRLSDDERALVASGADLVLTELTFGRPFTPIDIQWLQPGERVHDDSLRPAR